MTARRHLADLATFGGGFVFNQLTLSRFLGGGFVWTLAPADLGP